MDALASIRVNIDGYTHSVESSMRTTCGLAIPYSKDKKDREPIFNGKGITCETCKAGG